jgi:hypothetical protein
MSSLELEKALSGSASPKVKEVPKVNALFKPIDDVEEGEGLKCIVYGKPETGKTYFGLSFPEPIRVISTEFGVKKLRHHFPNKDIQLLECNVPFAEKPTDRKGNVIDTPFNTDPETSLKRIEAASFALEKIKGGTIVIDSASDIWSWLSLYLGNVGERSVSKKTGEEFIKGTEWAKINEAFRILVNRFNSLPCHLVICCRQKEDLEGNVGIKASKDVDHFVDISIHLEKIPRAIPGQEGKFTYVRQGTIKKCRYQSLNNLQVQDITFEKLKEEITNLDPSLENIFEVKLSSEKKVLS